MRSSALIYINGKKHEVSGSEGFMTLARYLRYVKSMTGTKIVCEEGDCGACSVLLYRPIENDRPLFKSINSCIASMYSLDGCHVVTVEGIKDGDELHPVQQSMVDNNGSQCGYCTPGFICAMVGLTDHIKTENKKLTEQKAKNFLTGNLCRCTGYTPIIDSCMKADTSKTKTTFERYHTPEIDKELRDASKLDLEINDEDKLAYIPSSVNKAVDIRSRKITPNSGGTDIGVLVNKRKIKLNEVVSFNNIEEFYQIEETDKYLRIGAKVTLERLEKATIKSFPELSKKLHIFASPQIKNIGTLIGNVANGSPIGDSLPFLMVNGTILNILGPKGPRQVPITKFYLGYKKFDLAPDELITSVDLLKSDHVYRLFKVSVRKDLDISAVTMAVKYKFNQKFDDFSISFGGVGPTVMKIDELENHFKGKTKDLAHFQTAGKLIKKIVKPLSDHRGSKEFRLKLCENLILKLGKEMQQ